METCLAVLWALSPIAGQATVRVLNLRNFTATTLLEVPWFAINSTSVITVDDEDVLTIQSTYISNLVSARELSMGTVLGVS